MTDSSSIVLTSHPLQRVGAFALLIVSGVDDASRTPETLTGEEIDVAVAAMTADLVSTAGLVDSRARGGFWLAASYMLWPNSAMNDSQRARRSVAERTERITGWRAYPQEPINPCVPCWLCGRPACGWYGKVDIPLGASIEHRNHTGPGHQGTPLCRACLVCLHAAPYGSLLARGRAVTLHSWDDEWLAATVRRQALRTRAAATARETEAPVHWQDHAVAELLATSRAPSSQLEVMVWSNSNRDQALVVHQLDESLARWWHGLTPERRQQLTDLLGPQTVINEVLFGGQRTVLRRITEQLHRQVDDPAVMDWPTVRALSSVGLEVGQAIP
ncbi:hypothetical protein [Nocardia noduli]|uniref:hypothetical protein n=1 Tax=Nocardia noduli TaxID=2815722 RepID=UPI001C2305D2|nr:hypothetical protein [Nocardia noduli]